MNLKIGAYNVKWMKNLFDSNEDPILGESEGKRSRALAKIVEIINPVFMGFVEGPDT